MSQPLLWQHCRRQIFFSRLSYHTTRTFTWHIPNVLKELIPKVFGYDPSRASLSPSALCSDSRASRMDITKSTFGHEAVRLLQDIAESHFIAFDFEFSGIAERNRDRATKQTIEERYEETRAAVQEYQPLQVGLTVCKFDVAKGQYVLEPYNFNISPLPSLRERYFTRKWSMNSGAISFLHKNGFDFGRQMVHGVPYLSLQEEDRARGRMTADSQREDLVWKPSDQILVDHVRQSIADWQAQPKDEQEPYLNIPHNGPTGISDELNGYQRRLVYQIVENEYPAMKTQGMGHFVQITNPTDEQVANRKALEEEARERDLARAIGLRWIMDGIIGRSPLRLPHDYLLPVLPDEAEDGDKLIPVFLEKLNSRLRERRKVLIGHNCLVDVMFLYKMTMGDLPESLGEFKDKVHDLFPAIVDTKFLSSCFSEKHGRLALGEVMQDLSLEAGGPSIHTSREFDRYITSMWLHEAGYDSYITAIVAIKMAAKLRKQGSARKNDAERQEELVAQAASSMSASDFGIQEGYVTPAESPGNLAECASPSRPKTPDRSPSDSFGCAQEPTGSITFITSDTATYSNSSAPSSTVAVKLHPSASPSSPPGVPTGAADKSQLPTLRSAFASTSIYDSFTDSVMPGDAQTKQQAEEDDETRMSRMVQEGKMMPRWVEEGAFWEVYGNKLQVNGTVEGVFRVVD